MFTFRKFAYVVLVVMLVFAFVGCDDDDDDNGNGGIVEPTGITIYWDNQSDYTVDFFLDGTFQQHVLSGQVGTTTGVSMGTHNLCGCLEGYEPGDGDRCESEIVGLTGDFTYTIH